MRSYRYTITKYERINLKVLILRNLFIDFLRTGFQTITKIHDSSQGYTQNTIQCIQHSWCVRYFFEKSALLTFFRALKCGLL